MPFDTREKREFNNAFDKRAYQVRHLKIALNRLGYYRPVDGVGITGEENTDFYQALELFQKNNFYLQGNKDIFNRLLEEELSAELTKKEQAEFAFTARYVWRTAGDSKVRHDHAVRDGRVYEWDNPPEGGHPGEDYGCRCWADPLVPLQPKGLSVGYEDLHDVQALARLDAIEPAIAPWELINSGAFVVRGGRLIAGSALATESGELIIKNAKIYKGRIVSQFTAKFRNTDWIDKTPVSQLQKKYSRHSKDFGVRGNYNKKRLESFKEEIKKHIQDKDTIIIKGKLHNKPMTHYYNTKTKLIVMRNKNGQFHTGWKMRKEQIENLFRSGKVGGSKK